MFRDDRDLSWWRREVRAPLWWYLALTVLVIALAVEAVFR